MKSIAIFLNELSLGGTEKAACSWAGYLSKRGHDVFAVALADGPRRSDLNRLNVPQRIPNRPSDPACIAELLEDAEVIHAHSPGYPHQGDILGEAMRVLRRKIPVVQTNIFGRLDNAAEETWTDFRLFISWTSCVQAARRARRKLDTEFFRRQSVAVNPVIDPFGIMTDDKLQMTDQGAGMTDRGDRISDDRLRMTDKTSFLLAQAEAFRDRLGIPRDAVVFGRFSRPEPNKWTPMVLDAFLAAYKVNPNIRLLLREPPPAVAAELISKNLAIWAKDSSLSAFQLFSFPVFLFLATSNPDKLTITQLACDVVLHTSSIGESFGYGLAEPMALGRPVITHSLPWGDQAQIELARHGECGLLASTASSMKSAILQMAERREWRAKCGDAARKHILEIANPEKSTNRVEMALKCAIDGIENPMAEQDLEKARKTAEYLDKHQWGHSFVEQVHLRSFTAKVTAIRTFHFVKKKLGI